ncbi:MAG: hypothetical protein RBS24_04345 [Bacilli bacterium]|nr:hypothetical protein [Bacilli bacterium]
MEIEFDNLKVSKLFSNLSLMEREKGKEITRKIKLRCDQIHAAETFDIYLKNAPGKCHPLKGNRKGQFGVSIDRNKRLVIMPIVENGDMSEQSLKKCKKIIIKGVIDYHGDKETIYIP